MRFAKIHPSFLIFFGLSLASFAVALVVAITAQDTCQDPDGDATENAACAARTQGDSATATVLALGGLAAMLGGVGFQIGRAAPAAAPAAVPQSAAVPYPIQAGYPAYPGPPGYPAPPASMAPPS